ncbi:unnamed protein product [Camellia sinensis]
MMMQALNPCTTTTTAKTAEIMSRYRPIAPRPEISTNSIEGSNHNSSSESPTIRRSPYLRNVWPHLQARPTRTRKRGRTAVAPPPIKRPRLHFFGLTSSPANNPSLQGFAHGGFNGLPQVPVSNSLLGIHEKLAQTQTTPSSLVTLSLLPCPIIPNQPPPPELNGIKPCEFEEVIDLNTVAQVVPEEKDLLQQLQGPISTHVIAPQPVRPVGSSICVGSINEDQGSNPDPRIPKKKKREEVEEEVESEALPAVVSDSNNKVRLANSAYKEMVGQPECSWLDSMVTCDGRHARGGASKRICGEVMLQFSDSCVPVDSSNGFSCWVTIEWGNNGKSSSVHAFCDVIRLTCESRDYLFEWRFHTREASESA